MSAYVNCKGCGKPLCWRNTSGACRKCFARFSPHKRTGNRDRDAMRRISHSRLAWCPVDLRPDYRHMTKIQGLRAFEARAIIEQHMKTQIARRYGRIAE